MTYLLLLTVLAGLLLPLLERLWRPLWHRWVFASPEPTARLGRLALWMSSGLLVAALLSHLLLERILASPPTTSLLPGGLLPCLGHAFVRGPGWLTHGLVASSAALLVLGLVALFHPLPGFPPGVRRPGWERWLDELGVPAAVEAVAHPSPGCWSEASPRARVVLLGGLEELLDEEEMRAVLAHEAAHLRRGDHRSRTWARAHRRLLHFFGGAGAVHDAFVHEQERRADDRTRRGDPPRGRALRRALVRLAAAEPLPRTSPVALGVQGSGVWSLRQRIVRLDGGEEEIPPPPPVSPFAALALLGLLGLATTPEGLCTLHCLLVALP